MSAGTTSDRGLASGGKLPATLAQGSATVGRGRSGVRSTATWTSEDREAIDVVPDAGRVPQTRVQTEGDDVTDPELEQLQVMIDRFLDDVMPIDPQYEPTPLELANPDLVPGFIPGGPFSHLHHDGLCGDRISCWNPNCRLENGVYGTVEILRNGEVLASCHGERLGRGERPRSYLAW
jgi:hypothetical protein